MRAPAYLARARTIFAAAKMLTRFRMPVLVNNTTREFGSNIELNEVVGEAGPYMRNLDALLDGEEAPYPAYLYTLYDILYTIYCNKLTKLYTVQYSL